MNSIEKFKYTTALTIAGSDCSGGAGIQADLKTFSALGVYGMSVLTAITAQNTHEVKGIQAVSCDMLCRQMEAVFEDIPVHAVKTGMLYSKESVETIACLFSKYIPDVLIIDPVMISTSGSRLMQEDAVEAVVQKLFPYATLITPNIDEAAYLSGIPIHTVQDMDKAGESILLSGCKAVLVKGGHMKGNCSTDRLLIKGQPPVAIEGKTIDTVNTHGTGCTLSSAITAYMALGKELTDAVVSAKKYIENALEAGADIVTGNGHGPVNHFFAPFPLLKKKITCN